MFSRPITHRVTEHRQGVIMRGSLPPMNTPPYRPIREPGTGYLTYITANGPRTIRPS